MRKTKLGHAIQSYIDGQLIFYALLTMIVRLFDMRYLVQNVRSLDLARTRGVIRSKASWFTNLAIR